MESAIQPGIYDPNFADRNITVRTEEAYTIARRLAREEGYLVGISAAAAMVGSLHVAEELAEDEQSATIVTIFPDNAYKYLSEPFWTKDEVS
jgi:cysteine synthase B